MRGAWGRVCRVADASAKCGASPPIFAIDRPRALAVETHENWLEGTRYLNMEHLRETKKLALRQAA